ncbi:type II secretion system F family protein [Stenotrophomonas sp. 24(2023)]|uniref:type II secretion system F family protein n=1 Tax=Stenotrophomonas sp. 24(2023) TaxID=3068324 RepID=UPI0027E00BF1|nr:type II secretion system F family protein [Stenotrophomonas sp. 24(2023)]WMJ69495.1 type II secretion system F family protein [Stenotrophomonas sp. 24(2023)]
MGTGLVLLLIAGATVLVAAALWLWGTASNREQQQASLQHAEQQLTRSGPITSLASDPTRAGGAPPAMPAASAQAPRSLPWDGVLQRAGLPVGWKVPVLLLLPGIALALFGMARLGTAWMLPITLLVYLIACGLWIVRRITRLQRRLLHQLPDFLDNLVRLTALGNSLQMSFQNASTQTTSPLRELLDTTVRNARSGMDLDRALQQAGQPYRMEVLNVLAVVLGVSVRIGGRADQVLQRMADFMRDLEQAQHELAATTSETRMSAWVLGLLPPACAVLMAITNPEFFQPVLHDPLGHKVLGLALALELIGGGLLYKLARSI